jgi:hypothetical protein
MILGDLMITRTISQILRVYAVPELHARLSAGSIQKDQLPLRLYQFRLLSGDGQNKMEFNDDVQVVVQAKARRAIQTGQGVTLDDIYAEETILERPIINGKPAAYFLCQSLPVGFLVIFDFLPNSPEITQDELAAVRQRYPITDFVRARQQLDTIQPIRQFRILSDKNWPPAPGYFPHILMKACDDPGGISSPGFLGIVETVYSQPYWEEYLEFWEETNFFPDRLSYIRKAIQEHFENDYISSIHVIVPQFEGIVRDYLKSCCTTTNYRFESCVRQLRDLVFSREFLLFPKDLLETIFLYIEKGSFLKETGNIIDPADEVNRHGIAHGVFTGFEGKTISLKYLILLESLALILLQDKILNGTL